MDAAGVATTTATSDIVEMSDVSFAWPGRAGFSLTIDRFTLKRGHKVLLLGFISDEDRNLLYKVADCAVFPSLYEPFGIVALEAMAARTPVVVSEVGGLPEVVRHAETGITIYPGDVASCAWGIVHALQHPEWARMRAENAYRQVLTTFSWDTIAERTLRVYERIVAERAASDW